MDLMDCPGHAAEGLDRIHCYRAGRPGGWNRCGQAAVATLLDYYGLDPFGLRKPVYDPKNGRRHWDPGEVVDCIAREFPPDHLFGLFGTTARRIDAALASYGLKVRVARSRKAAQGRRILSDIKEFASSGSPSIVLLDMGKLGGRPFTAHWAVVCRAEGSAVYLANCGRRPTAVPEERFLSAFRCRFMPRGLNHCAIFAHPPFGAFERFPG